MATDDPHQERPMLARSSNPRSKSKKKKMNRAQESRQKLRVEMGKFVLKLLLLGMLFCAFYVTLFSGGQPPVPVTGAVTYNGEPLPNVSVVCIGRRTATGWTDELGRFSELTTNAPGDGAFPGEYQVGIIPVADAPPVEEPVSYEPPTSPPYPTRYLSAETSGLSIKVTKKGKNHFELKLQD